MVQGLVVPKSPERALVGVERTAPEPVRPLPALQLLLWHSALWTVQEAAPLGPARHLPETFLLKCLEQVRKLQADVLVMQQRLVSEGLAARRAGTHMLPSGCRGKRTEESAEGGEGKCVCVCVGASGGPGSREARGQGREVGEGEP